MKELTSKENQVVQVISGHKIRIIIIDTIQERIFEQELEKASYFEKYSRKHKLPFYLGKRRRF